MEKLAFSFYTIKHYADVVKKSPRTVRRWCTEGRVKWKRDRGGRGILILVRNVKDFVKN